MVPGLRTARFRTTGCSRPAACSGFTLVEIITVVAIASLLTIAVVQVYSRIHRTGDVLLQRLEENALPTEILQRIAEDLDRMAAPGLDTGVTIHNKLKNGFNVAQLVIETRYYEGSTNPVPRTYEKVVWQTDYDPWTDSLILYRAHSGLKLEDGVIDRTLTGEPVEGADWFVPLCDGITYFALHVPHGENFLTDWSQSQPPKAVTVTISTAPPVENEFGEVYIPEDKIFNRTIAVDRTRKIRFQFVEGEFDMSEFDSNDPNELTDLRDEQQSGGEDLTTDPLEDSLPETESTPAPREPLGPRP